MRRISVFSVALAVCWANAAYSFDPKTHVWIAQQILNDVVPDGKVTIGGNEFIVPPSVVEALRANPGIYRMGHIGPDAHPDIVVGQSFIHPGTRGGFGADDWASWIERRARESGDARSIAYAAGVWGHLAGDVVAHSYVNTYAGDFFSILDEQEVERRHIVLEKYIGRRTPPIRDHNGQPIAAFDKSLQSPSEFLAKTLILNETVDSQYGKSQFLAVHLRSIHRLHQTVARLRAALEKTRNPIGAELSRLEAARVAADSEVRKLVERLAALAPTLDPMVRQLDVLKRAVETQQAANATLLASASAADRAVAKATGALTTLDTQIAANTRQLAREVTRPLAAANASIKALDGQIKQASTAVTNASNEASRLRDLRGQIEGQIDSIRDRLGRLIIPPKIFGRSHPARDAAKRLQSSLNGDLGNALDRLSGAERDLAAAEERVRNTGTSLGQLTAKRATAAKNRATLGAKKTNLDAARARLDRSRRSAVAQLTTLQRQAGNANTTLQKAITDLATAKKAFDKAGQSLASLRETLASLESERALAMTALTAAEKSLRVVTGLRDRIFADPVAGLASLVRRWEVDIERAATEYIEANTRVMIALMTGGDALRPLQDWYTCWAPVLTGIPSSITVPACEAVFTFREISEKLKASVEEVASTIPIVRDLLAAIRALEAEVKERLVDAGIDLADKIFGDELVSTVTLFSKEYTDKDLDEEFREDTSGKGLLSFPNFSRTVRADLGMPAEGEGLFDVDRFASASNAVTLAKLALLDVSGANSLADSFGIAPAYRSLYSTSEDSADRARLLYPKPEVFVNVLFRAARSIDGNQQWRGFGLPYLRVGDGFTNTTDNDFGYCREEDDDFGFRLWVDREYRSKVMAKILPALSKLDALAPGIAPELSPMKRPNFPVDGDAEEACVADLGGEKSPNPHDVPPRDQNARNELAARRRAEIESGQPLRPIDRIDRQSVEQIRNLSRIRP